MFVAEDESGKDGEAGNAVALSMQPDAAERSRKQKMATRFLQTALKARTAETQARHAEMRNILQKDPAPRDDNRIQQTTNEADG